MAAAPAVVAEPAAVVAVAAEEEAAEVAPADASSGFTTDRVSFITDDIIVQRYVEIDGHLRTVLVVTKMRGSGHTREFRRYELTPRGAVIGEPLPGYQGIITGVPTLTRPASP